MNATIRSGSGISRKDVKVLMSSYYDNKKKMENTSVVSGVKPLAMLSKSKS